MAVWQRNKKQAGASRKTADKKVRRVSPVLVYRCLLAVILAVAIATLYPLVNAWVSKPVSRVAISGDFLHVDKQLLTEKIKPFLAEGFVLMNLQGVQAELEILPWVREARVKRQWPDQILIHVLEEQPIARWGNQGYLNHNGQLFKPEKIEPIAGLPVLNGPENMTEVVMTRFYQLRELLQHYELSLHQLSVDERRNWRAVINDSTLLVLGSDQVMAKAKDFIRVYDARLRTQFNNVERVDMRYSNGLAVQWRDREKNS